MAEIETEAAKVLMLTERWLQTDNILVERSVIQNPPGNIVVHANRILVRQANTREFSAYPAGSTS